MRPRDEAAWLARIGAQVLRARLWAGVEAMQEFVDDAWECVLLVGLYCLALTVVVAEEILQRLLGDE